MSVRSNAIDGFLEKFNQMKAKPQDLERDQVADSGNSAQRDGSASTDDETLVRRSLISKPIVEGKTYTTILYEVIASMDSPFAIKYFKVDSTKPRTRGGRFVIECHLDDQLYGTGEGPSKKAAKQIASEVALEKLVEEFPRLKADVERIKAGFPSRQKLRTRRRPNRHPQHHKGPRDRAHAWRSRQREQHHHHHHQQAMPFADPLAHTLAREAHRRRRFAREYEQVRDLVRNIDSLTNILGRSRDMSLRESDTMQDYLSFEDYQDYLTTTKLMDSERDMGYMNDPYTNMNNMNSVDNHRDYKKQPDTEDFMRKMQKYAQSSSPV